MDVDGLPASPAGSQAAPPPPGGRRGRRAPLRGTRREGAAARPEAWRRRLSVPTAGCRRPRRPVPAPSGSTPPSRSSRRQRPRGGSWSPCRASPRPSPPPARRGAGCASAGRTTASGPARTPRSGTAPSGGADVPFFQEGAPPAGLVREATFEYCFSYAAPVINMRRYLDWLTESLGALPGVRLQQRHLAGPADVAVLAANSGADVVVNCLGLGAGAVFGDAAVHAVRGDLVYVLAPGAAARHGLAHVSDEDAPSGLLTYAVPQGEGVVALAGTLRPLGAEELEDGYSVREDAVRDGEVAASIAARVAAAFPGAVLPPPGAPAARLVHNYGHGGSGVVTSWGCAAEVCALAAEALGAAGAGGLRARALPSALAPLAVESVRAAGGAALARAVAEGAAGRVAAR
ncbi:unnamed protein product, partial [Prorocentrum cordatum]